MESLDTKIPPVFGSAANAASSHPVRRVGHRQWPFVLADLGWILSGAMLTLVLRFHSLVAHAVVFLPFEHFLLATSYAAFIVLLCHFEGLYSSDHVMRQIEEVAAVVKSVFMATVLLSGVVFVSGTKEASRLVVLATGVLALLGMTGWRLFRWWSLQRAVADGVTCHNVLIVGTDSVALALSRYLNEHTHLGFVVVGHLSIDQDVSETHCNPIGSGGAAELGTISELKYLCRKYFADEIFVCAIDRDVVLRAIADARECGVGIRVIPDLYDGAALGARLQYIGEFPSLALVLRSIPAVSMRLKRAFDIALAILALLFLAPLMILLAVVIKLESTGPIFYKSIRVGRKGRSFVCYKYRTMAADAEQRKAELAHLNERSQILFKIANDPRITRVGRTFRKYSLDELPQLWNVVKGDMSLVGPRPPIDTEVANYPSEYLRRLDVAPGITGLWQVEARRHPSFERYISLDLYYVEHWSFVLDLQILLRTVRVVFAGTGS
jgi:exopolysaccharide biosynthesis polyprenyl glycosylphosphotransferase